MSTHSIYLAAPFFNEEQISVVSRLESIIPVLGFGIFSPRLQSNAIEMNKLISRGAKPSEDLRNKVFDDNWKSIRTADLMVAVIDNFDVGVMWEVGFAYAVSTPVISFTNNNYGCNLMLAQSVIGHVKSYDSLKYVLSYLYENGLSKSSIQHISKEFKNEEALREGPDERA